MDPQTLEGIIGAGFMGLVFGNFSTSPIYRLPRKESLFLRDPYCGDCNAKLKPIDLFPVLSWLMTKGKCRYCGASVPWLYAAIEGFMGLLYVFCFLRVGFTEDFILVSFGMTTLVMIALMLYLDNFFSGKTAIAAIFLGTVYHTIHEGTFYYAAGGAFGGLIVGGLFWRYSGDPLIRDMVAFPGYMTLLIVAGVWLPFPLFLLACLLALIVFPFRKGSPWIVEWTIIAFTLTEVCLQLH